MKLTKRKGFNFFRSYYDVYNELSDKDKVQFMDALLDRQFLGIKPDNLTGMAKFAYISQTNSIDTQVKGYEDKTGIKLGVASTPTVGGRQGGSLPPTEQVQEKEKEKEKVQEKEKKKSGRFTPPSLQEIKNLAIERNYLNFNAETFLNFYESKGWMVGKSKMKDWKASAALWNSRNKNNENGKINKGNHSSPAKRIATDFSNNGGFSRG